MPEQMDLPMFGAGDARPECAPNELPSIGGEIALAEDQPGGLAYTTWQDEYIRSPVEPIVRDLANRWQGVQKGASERSIRDKITRLRERRRKFWAAVRSTAAGEQVGVMASAARSAAVEHVSVSGGLKRAMAAALYQTDDDGTILVNDDELPKLRRGLEPADIASLARTLKTVQEVDFAACGVLDGHHPAASQFGGVMGNIKPGSASYTLIELVRTVQSGGVETSAAFVQQVLAADPEINENSILIAQAQVG